MILIFKVLMLTFQIQLSTATNYYDRNKRKAKVNNNYLSFLQLNDKTYGQLARSQYYLFLQCITLFTNSLQTNLMPRGIANLKMFISQEKKKKLKMLLLW